MNQMEYWLCAGIDREGKRYECRATWYKYTNPNEAIQECFGTHFNEGFVAKPIGTRKILSYSKFNKLIKEDCGWIQGKRK
jgi:hypothetical protein